MRFQAWVFNSLKTWVAIRLTKTAYFEALVFSKVSSPSLTPLIISCTPALPSAAARLSSMVPASKGLVPLSDGASLQEDCGS